MSAEPVAGGLVQYPSGTSRPTGILDDIMAGAYSERTEPPQIQDLPRDAQGRAIPTALVEGGDV